MGHPIARRPVRALLLAALLFVAVGAGNAGAASRPVNVSGGYQLYVHVQAGVTIAYDVFSLSQHGHKLSGSATSGTVTYSVSGRISGTTVHFDFHGASGYVAHFSGNTTCGGTELFGGWVDIAAEGGSWNAYRDAGGSGGGSQSGCMYEVRGKVTDAASGKGVPSVPVTAKCAGGGTIATERNGDYSFLLSPGKCVLSATPPAGLEVTPSERRVQVTSHPIPNVDFQVGCVHAQATAAAVGSTCLDVQVKQIGPARSGLAIYGHSAHEEASRAFFLPPFSRQCASGCTNLLVTVTDPSTHQPVPDATVSASVSDVRGVTGEGYLCDQAAAKDCGTHLLNSTTDAEGQVHLLYWSPGLIEAARPEVKALAREGTHEGSAALTFTVKPYLVYDHVGTLSRKETLELAYWAAGKGLIGKLGGLIGGASALEKGLGFSLNVLIGAEVVAERAVAVLETVEAVTPIIGVLEVAHVGSELWERQGIISTFLDAIDLSAIGIDDNPVERSVSAAPSAGFESHLANLGTAAPFHIGAGGLLWEYAKHLDFLFSNNDVAFGAQFLHVKVYEVSHCVLGEPCGPGYRAYVGGGIQPELYIEVSAGRNRRAQSFAPHSFTISYDPNAWAETQHELRDLSH
ncbi:MAG TPA: hypothetical protein VII87_04505, partial [Solirubrobacteraceae bacterium]